MKNKDIYQKNPATLEPEAHYIHLPRTTIKTEKEIDQWLIEVKKRLVIALDEGPVMIR